MDIKEIIRLAAHQEFSKYSWYGNNYADPGELSDKEIYGILSESDEVYREDEGSSRWWNNVSIVVKVGDKYFEYGSAETTGDNSPRDCGWEFDITTVREVIPVEETITVTKYHTVS